MGVNSDRKEMHRRRFLAGDQKSDSKKCESILKLFSNKRENTIILDNAINEPAIINGLRDSLLTVIHSENYIITITNTCHQQMLDLNKLEKENAELKNTVK